MTSSERAKTFSLGRALLRKHLSETLHTVPEKLEILVTPQGKPFLASSPSPLSFSLSHSRDRILLALSPRGWSFGVDIEFKQDRTEIDLLGRRLFSQDDYGDLSLLTGPAQRDRFFDLWCLYEARFKMQGSSEKKDPREASLIENLDKDYHFALCYLDPQK